MLESKNKNIKTIVQTGLLIALAIVIKNFSYMVYFGGAPGMRIGFSGIFTKIASILFGPLIGGIASGVTDIMGFIIKPEGAYIPLLTVTAIVGGILTGLIWKAFFNTEIRKIRIFLIIFFVISGLFGLYNHLHILFFPDSTWLRILEMVGKYKDFTTIGLEIISLVGLSFLIIDYFVKRSNVFHHSDAFLKILIATVISGILVTTLNTLILQSFIPALGKIGFMVFWIPRILQEIFMSVIQAYIISLLLSIYWKYIKS